MKISTIIETETASFTLLFSAAVLGCQNKSIINFVKLQCHKQAKPQLITLSPLSLSRTWRRNGCCQDIYESEASLVLCSTASDSHQSMELYWHKAMIERGRENTFISASPKCITLAACTHLLFCGFVVSQSVSRVTMKLSVCASVSEWPADRVRLPGCHKS